MKSKEVFKIFESASSDIKKSINKILEEELIPDKTGTYIFTPKSYEDAKQAIAEIVFDNNLVGPDKITDFVQMLINSHIITYIS